MIFKPRNVTHALSTLSKSLKNLQDLQARLYAKHDKDNARAGALLDRAEANKAEADRAGRVAAKVEELLA